MLSCLYSVVRNTSGRTLHLGYLPGHGRDLADGEEFSVAGDLATRLALHPAADRVFPAFENDLDTTQIALLQTPAVHLYDATLDETRVLSLNNGTLGKLAPCWGWYSESEAGG